MRRDDPMQHLRDAVRLSAIDVLALLACVTCFALMIVAERLGYDPTPFAFWGPIAFSVWLLSILNRVVGTLHLMHRRIYKLEREVEDLHDALERAREARQVLPDELRN
jgi:hypothetical protein